MKALSIRQPWAELILRGLKDVENRSWFTRYTGPLLVHVSRTADEHRFAEYGLTDDLPCGRLVGVVDLHANAEVRSRKANLAKGDKVTPPEEKEK